MIYKKSNIVMSQLREEKISGPLSKKHTTTTDQLISLLRFISSYFLVITSITIQTGSYAPQYMDDKEHNQQ